MYTVTWKEPDKKGKEQIVTRSVRHLWQATALASLKRQFHPTFEGTDAGPDFSDFHYSNAYHPFDEEKPFVVQNSFVGGNHDQR